MAKHWLKTALIAACVWALPGQALAATVVVDAGHGGYDPGAIGVNGLEEKFVNLDISQRLRDLLLQRGYDVRMSRDTDTYLTLSERVAFAKSQNADFFVSVHANSHPNSGVRGTMVLYYDSGYPQSDYPASPEMEALTPESKKLAQTVLDQFVKTAGVQDRGLVPSAVYVVRKGNIPSILVETAFLSNEEDAGLLADEAVRQRMALGIADGIEAYMPANLVFPDTRGHWAREAILRLKDRGVVDGTGSLFEPSRALTRAEWMTLLGRIFDIKAAAAKSGTVTTASVSADVYGSAGEFRDVSQTHWAYSALDQGVKVGLLEGYPDGTLRPDQPVSRAEAAELFQRLSQIGTPSGKVQPFRDVPAAYWAAPAIAALKNSGVVGGVSDVEFAPERSISRAEAAAMLDRYLASKK